MEKILNEKNKKYAENCFQKSIEIGLDFKLNNEVKKEKMDLWEFSKLSQTGITVDKILNDFNVNIKPFCTNFSNVNFMGFPDAGNSIAGISAAILSDFMQQNLINSSFCAPVATFMEIDVINWLRDVIGYKVNYNIKTVNDIGGLITYGGTGSNSIAMLLARENHKKNTMKNGVVSPEDFKVIIPKGIGHYSIRSSLMWIGCGDNVIEVETDNYKYNLDSLKKALEDNKGKVMCVVSYVGDSRTMTIENLNEVYNIVKGFDKNIWLHADACHGFSLAFSKKLKSKIFGIEKFDSISTDPHKVLMIPYCISALLLKNPQQIKTIFSSSDLIMQEELALGQITPFIGSKSWVSLKLWMTLRNFGIKGIGDIIERRCEMAQYLKREIMNRKDFILLNDVDINSVVFMYVGNYKTDDINFLNDLNKEIYNYLLDEVKYYLHKFSILDNRGVIKKNELLIPLRYMSGNDNIRKKDVVDMLNHIVAVAKKIKR